MGGSFLCGNRGTGLKTGSSETLAAPVQNPSSSVQCPEDGDSNCTDLMELLQGLNEIIHLKY